MQNINIIPLGPGTYDDAYVYWVDKPIIAEKTKLVFYGGYGSVSGYNIAVATIPVTSPFFAMDAEAKDVSTHQSSPRNQLVKQGSVIPHGGGGTIDSNMAGYPAAVYDFKRKRYLVYYLGLNGGGVYAICLAYGTRYNDLTKYNVGGTTTEIITPGGAYDVSAIAPEAEYDKEENLFKLWYTLQTKVGGYTSRWLATSVDGIVF